MENCEKFSVRGAINGLKVKGSLNLPLADHTPSSVRSTASSLKVDTGKRFSVSVKNDKIVITRKS